MINFSFVQGKKDHLCLVSEIFELISLEAQKENMCFQSQHDLVSQISRGDAIIAFKEEEWIGYCYLHFWNNYSEICGSVVNPKFRNQGVGTKLKKACLELALEKYPEKEVITLSHDASMHVSLKLGFEIKDKEDFDPELWELCCQCKSYDKFPDCRCIGMVYSKG